jgi:preprotein translocase SecE subunit
MKKFMHDALLELSQITWLTKKQAIRISIITIIFVIVSAFILWGVDTGFTSLYKLISQ